MYQRITVIGNLGRDPELRYTPSGEAVTDLSVATTESWKDTEGVKKDRTTWWKVAVWGKQAETCNQFLKKGSKVLVEGTMRGDEKGNPRTFQRQDGSWGASYEMTAKDVRFMSSRSEGTGSPVANGSGEFEGAMAATEDDLPF